MKKFIIILSLFYTLCTAVWAQNTEWHVRAYADNYTNPSGADGTSFEKAWCLQYALTGAGGAIQGGDTVWLHGVQRSTYNGTTNATVYKGHFTCNINVSGPEIMIASYPGEWAIIDGNIHNSPSGPVTPNPACFNPPNAPEGFQGSHVIFAVTANNIHFHDFEVTCLGNFSRVHEARKINNTKNAPLCEVFHEYNFYEYTGINHTAGVNRFTNLVVRNIPGVGFGSWKFTADSEIYGNILYNNGVIDIKGTSCAPTLTNVVNSGLTIGNTGGHQASIYTQNEHESAIRNIRNNILHNCYDSGLIIWSAREELAADEFVRNYSVSKNVFINNGAPVRDETANMLISTVNNPIRNIAVDSNIFYINFPSSYVSGVLVQNANNVTFTHNYLINGTAGMIFNGENNHGINFNNNVYFGKRLQVLTSVANFTSTVPGMGWNFHHNTYFNKYMGTDDLYMFFAPTNVSHSSIPLSTFSTNYNTETGSTATAFSTALPARYFITQNRENTNLFYVTIYNPAQNGNAFPVDFSAYNITSNQIFRLRDVQNYFTPIVLSGGNNMPASGIVSLPMNLTNFEMPLPAPHSTTSVFGPTYVTTPSHSGSDLNTFAIEFDCGLEYDRTVSGNSNVESEYILRNNITFENYTSNTSVIDVTARASRQILLKPNTHIKSGNLFLARIEATCAEIPYNTLLADAAFDMGAGLNRNNASSVESNAKNKNLFSLYPNPNGGVFTIAGLSGQKIAKVAIYQIDTGKQVLNQDCKADTSVEIDISQTSKGWHSVQVFFEDHSSDSRTIFVE